MKRTIPLFALGWILSQGMTLAASAEIYRWTDAEGQAHFTMDLGRVPPAYRAAAEASAGTAGKGANINMIPSAQERRSDPPPAPAARKPSSRHDSAPTREAIETVGGHDEAWWRSQAASYLTRIESLETAIAACEDVRAPQRYNPDTGRRMKRRHYDQKMDAIDRCSNNESNLVATERQLANFKERARQQGVPPGWLRAR